MKSCGAFLPLTIHLVAPSSYVPVHEMSGMNIENGSGFLEVASANQWY
jgi:hypothetical protein